MSFIAEPGRYIPMLAKHVCEVCEAVWLESYSLNCPDCERRRLKRFLNIYVEEDTRERPGVPILRNTGGGTRIGRNLAGETQEFFKWFQDFTGKWWRKGTVVSPNGRRNTSGNKSGAVLL